MTRIDFHTNVGDPLAYACRLARKAYLSGKPLVVLAEPQRLAAFDEQLWTFQPLEFVPHCMAKSPLAEDTPVVLTSNLDEAPHHHVLVNLGAPVSAQFARFERLVEIVGSDGDDLAAGRERYRFYRDRGYAIETHNQGG
ncbi:MULTISPECIES: DNA polymerase III subunit chi [Caballeronia]|uniref:DNA polymerase III subunit chi n=1 Tax=Caballeronia cordobensis TaxID=1353886 RepID=A0A158IZJ6_CABCO|nr:MULTISPECIES: DNA polymerase III subunit chi [Caballeronia]AET88423.1 DNA polymerase III chi subunit HolC [Burkholderia sp. YI23]BAO85635.1 DNA polymerase III chi subunit HolC [Burkholderia sp. RPE67]BBP95470.1 DNA polymerase III subunit chi [Burkholderia sp. SFA1]MCE4542635.1 DNA polymerase III subunit chi [Caballeronia sp. PC1]MCE4568309.1 DNA polymerase III subunit chi [Caballeronia sp. CLC5]